MSATPAPTEAWPDPTPAPPHAATEFFGWLWYASERDGGTFALEDGSVFTFWVDDRLSFRLPDEDKARAVLTGESEYHVTLRGVHLDLQGAKLPAELKAKDAVDEVLYERTFLLDELWFLVGSLYKRFAAERTSEAWRAEHLPAMRRWAAEQDEVGGG
ncbi:hypothetical protein L6R53_20840 [Myxococcota bacterium]|nr:hypothetical protein [Myxococcota bacterium]